MKSILEYCIESQNELTNYNQQSFGWEKYNQDPFIKIADYKQITNEIPKEISRSNIIDAFKNGEYYKGYVMALLWGGIGAQPRKGSNRDIKTSNAYIALSFDKDKINNGLFKIKSAIEKGNSESAYNQFENEFKIPGIGPSYFTKLLSFISESLDNNNLLIYDKWTKLIHIHLILDNNDDRSANKFYGKRLNDLLTKDKQGKYKTNLIFPLKGQSWNAYYDYCNRMKILSNKLGSDMSPFQLESYLFGKMLKVKANNSPSNPRYWIQKNFVNEYLSKITG